MWQNGDQNKWVILNHDLVKEEPSYMAKILEIYFESEFYFWEHEEEPGLIFTHKCFTFLRNMPCRLLNSSTSDFNLTFLMCTKAELRNSNAMKINQEGNAPRKYD